MKALKEYELGTADLRDDNHKCVPFERCLVNKENSLEIILHCVLQRLHEEPLLKIAIVGASGVGKSRFFNELANYEEKTFDKYDYKTSLRNQIRCFDRFHGEEEEEATCAQVYTTHTDKNMNIADLIVLIKPKSLDVYKKHMKDARFDKKEQLELLSKVNDISKRILKDIILKYKKPNIILNVLK